MHQTQPIKPTYEIEDPILEKDEPSTKSDRPPSRIDKQEIEAQVNAPVETENKIDTPIPED